MTDAIVIFDVGATLVFGPDRGPASRIAAELGLTGDQKRQLEHALMTSGWESSHLVGAFLHDTLGVRDARLQAVVDDIWFAQENEATPIEGAEAAVRRIADAGFRIGIVSNIWQPFLVAARKHFGGFIDAYVRREHQFYSYREGIAKPSEQVFRRILDRAGVAPHRAVMVGDSYREDMEPAIRAGMSTVWLLHRPEKEAQNTVRVLNGDAPAPSHALGAIAELEPHLIHSLLARREAEAIRPVARRA